MLEKLASLKAECNICTENIVVDDLDDLKCGHFFHKECISPYLEMKITEKDIPIKCP